MGSSKVTGHRRARTLAGQRCLELIALMVLVAVGAAVAVYAGNAFGPFGYLVGFVVGVIGVIGAFTVLIAIDTQWRRGSPFLPMCRERKCGAEDYVAIRYKILGEQEVIWECRCGSKYTRRGRRVFEVLQAGEIRPYMIWRSFRCWSPDTAEAHAVESPYRT